MTPEQWSSLVATFISQVGFPIFVAVFLLFRLDKTLKGLTEALQGIKECLAKLPVP